MECNCDLWKENWDKVKNIFILAWIHDIKYTGEEFVYCPWCGKMLDEHSKQHNQVEMTTAIA